MKSAKMRVTLVDWMGDDLSVVNAARVSFDKEHITIDSRDEKLIKYLAEHNHWSRSDMHHCNLESKHLYLLLDN